MAPSDVDAQNLFWSYVIPVSIAIIPAVLLKGYFKRIYQIAYASFMQRFTVKYNKKLGHRKKKLFDNLINQSAQPESKLTILEVGAGTGSNFKYFPQGSNVVCLDPNPYFQSYLTKNSDQHPNIQLKDFIIGTMEDMSAIPNESIDAVVCTLVLCSVPDIDLCLNEIKRVLRKGGKFLFMEHVRADPRSWLYTVQRITTPLWKKIADGCHYTGTPWINIENAGFETVTLEHFTEKLTRINVVGPHVAGVAVK